MHTTQHSQYRDPNIHSDTNSHIHNNILIPHIHLGWANRFISETR